jgi:hypothetical protein
MDFLYDIEYVLVGLSDWHAFTTLKKCFQYYLSICRLIICLRVCWSTLNALSKSICVFFCITAFYTRICRCWCTMSMMQCVHVHIPQLTYHLRWTSPYIFGKVHINKEEIVVLMLCKSHATSNMLDINNFMMIWTKTIQFHCRSRKKITKYMPRVNALHQLVFLWKGPPTLRPLRSSGQVPAGYLALVSPQGIGEKKWEAFNHHQKKTPENMETYSVDLLTLVFSQGWILFR